MVTLSRYQAVQGSALNEVAIALSEASSWERVARKESDEHLLVYVIWNIEHFQFKTKVHVHNVHKIENRLHFHLFFGD